MTTESIADHDLDLSQLLRSFAKGRKRYEITSGGAPIAVLLGVDDYDSLLETIDVLGEPDVAALLEEQLATEDERDLFSSAQVDAEMVARRGHSPR